MVRIRFVVPGALALATALCPAATAQTARVPGEIVQPINPDAEALSTEIRLLAADPRNLAALLRAATLSVRLGDTAGALALLQRAEAIEPGNPRILAERGMVLVRLERPGEALRLFKAAEARGLDMRDYAADRGFAYDLVGQPELAQRDYRTALAADRDDETVRRYALSLGIAGDSAAAMRELEPLLRRSDRAAWRARAFILAMDGDVAGADRIASSMMPGGAGTALMPFFRRIATLSPADRAFAVHFGELSPTQARLSDARLAPALPPYVPRGKPVQVAAVAAAPLARQAEPKGRDRKGRGRREAAPAVATSPVQVAAVRPPVSTTPRAPVVTTKAVPERRAAPMVASAGDTRRTDTPPAAAAPTVSTRSDAPAPGTSSGALPQERTVARLQPMAPTAAGPAAAPVASSGAATPPARTVETAAVSPRVEPASPAASVEPRGEEPAPVTGGRPVQMVNIVPVAPSPRPRVGGEDSVLASIVAGITVPGSELEALNAAPPADPVPLPEAEAPNPELRPSPAVETSPVAPKAEVRAPAAKAVDAKPAAKPEAKAAARKTDPKKPDPKKAEPRKPAPEKADPRRVWVQVAGGANEASLGKAWKGVVAKAPAAMRGRSGWWTPLRATNRVLAGPFKTADEAQAFVNTLNKAGVPAFVFTSEAGQKVTRLGAE